MNIKLLIIIIATVYLLGFFSHALYLKKTVYGDGIYYYSWMRSMVIDHDINFKNEYDYLGVDWKPTAKGLLGNIYAVGPAILWMPAFLWIHSIIGRNGFSLLYQLTTGTTSVLYVITGLIILAKLLSNFFHKSEIILTIVSIAFATNLFFYGSLDTVNSHSLSFFISTIFLYLVLTKVRSAFWIGLSLGFLALIRQQDMLFIILAFPILNRKTIFSFIFGLLVGFSPQLIAWQALYGQFWHSPYLDRGYGFDFFHPQILKVLFSPRNGLILWTPMAGIAMIGFFLKNFSKNINLWTFVSLIIAQVLLISSWTTWWQGASYSGRMFISLISVFSFGLSAVFKTLLTKGVSTTVIFFSLVAPLIITNIFLMIYFLLII